MEEEHHQRPRLHIKPPRWWETFPGEKHRGCRRRTCTSPCLWTRECRWWRRSNSLQPEVPGWSLYPSPSGKSCSRFGRAPVRPALRVFPWRLRASWRKSSCRCRGAFWEPVNHFPGSHWEHVDPVNLLQITFILNMTSACVELNARWV